MPLVCSGPAAYATVYRLKEEGMKPRRMTTLSAGIAFVTLAAATASGQHVLTPEAIVSLRTVSSVAIDPAGWHIAYIFDTPRGSEEEAGSTHRELFVMPASGGTPRQFTHRPDRASLIQWSPDSRWIYFTSLRKAVNEHSQVYRIPVDGGEAELVTRAENGVIRYRVSPDGGSIAYTSKDVKTDQEREAERKGLDVQTVDREFKYDRLYMESMGTREAELLTGSLNVWSFEWSPDGQRIAFQASVTPKIDDSLMSRKVYVAFTDGSRPPRLLLDPKAKLGNMAWSPNHSSIALLAGVDDSDPAAGSIFVIPSDGGEMRNLSENFEGTVRWVGWLDGETLIFSAIERSHMTLGTVSATGSGFKRIIDGGVGFFAPSLTADRQKLALAAHTDNHPAEVMTGGLSGAPLTRQTDHNPILAQTRLAGSQEIRWGASDGLEITGLLMLPLDYEAGKRYPLIVQIHGGPESAYVDGWTTGYLAWSELLASHGYVVFSPNYRGSIGRGVDYSKANHKDLGGREFQDVIDGIEYLVREGYVDPDRVGIGGFSYGGYFSALAATLYSSRFRAASMGAGISNWLSLTGTSDIPHENSMVHWNLEVFRNTSLVWERSPLAHADASQTALLLSHGREDRRVPIGQSLELYTALKMLGKTVELDIYPREGHGFTEHNHQLYFVQRNLEWFDKHVKGGESN